MLDLELWTRFLYCSRVSCARAPLGIAILILVVIRYVNRWINPPPPFPASMPPQERLIAHVSELSMYAMMFALPLIGWAMLSAANYPIVLWVAAPAAHPTPQC